jgi:hypothetical protein
VSNGSSNVALAQSSLFWDTTNNRLGIKTDTPAVELDVKGDIAVSSYLYLRTPGDSTYALGYVSDLTGTGFAAVYLSGDNTIVYGSTFASLSAGSTLNMYSEAEARIEALQKLDVVSGGDFNVTASTAIHITGSLIPSADNTYDLGAPGSTFRTLYVAASTINIGTGRISADSGGNVFVTNSQNRSTYISTSGGGGGGSSTKITVAAVTGIILNSSSSPALTTATYGTYYSITNSAFDTITLPNSAGADTGSFWVFRNNTRAYLNITVTYTGSTSGEDTGIVTIPPENSLTIVFTSSGAGVGSYTCF